MLHILLLILKIIGIILAVILGILVLLICIVIFVPVRYEINGRCGGAFSTLKAKGKVTWLCSLVRADIYYKENKLKWRLRIAWKKFHGGQEYEAFVSADERLSGDMDMQIKRMKGEEDEKKDEKSQESDEEDGYQSVEDEENSKESEEELIEDEKIYQKILESIEEEDSGDEKRDRKGREADEERDRKKRGDDEEHNREGSSWIKDFIQRIKALYLRIKCTIRNICDKIKKLLEKKNKILGFIQDELHVKAFRKAKKEVFRLLKRLRPKKFLLEAKFGFDDPSWTGRLLAAIAPFYPFFEGAVSLKPNFEKKMLAGRLYAKGHVRFCHFAVIAWNLFWSRNIRRTYKDIKNFEI